jgi:hypothetical protein
MDGRNDLLNELCPPYPSKYHDIRHDFSLVDYQAFLTRAGHSLCASRSCLANLRLRPQLLPDG